ncbi:MAG: hypothetical protein MHMPM18_001547 [Marteilia pararefringens]
MFFEIFLIIFQLNCIQSSRNCCSITISQEWISKFSPEALEEICNVCSQLFNRSYEPFGFLIKNLNFNFLLMQRSFIRLLKNHYALSNQFDFLYFFFNNQKIID